jgi:predicted PurR-regulated permease PerM
MSNAEQMTEDRSGLARITLGVLFIGGLIAGSLWILWPFLGAFIWATMIVVATWPILLGLERLFGGRRGAAVAVMSLGLLAVLIVPLGFALSTIFGQADELAELFERLPSLELPAAPAWVGKLPLVGERLLAAWNHAASVGITDLLASVQPYAGKAAAWLAGQAGSFALLIVQFILIVILSAVLYSGGEAWGRWVQGFGGRLAGEQGKRIVLLAGGAIRGVAMGVVVTALIQAVLGGLGLIIVGVPMAGVLTAIMFAFCIAQLGPILVLLGATAWAYYAIGPGWGTFLLVWSLVVGLMDNFVRPLLIRRGADLPLLLIFAGVIGGLVAFGIVGIFVGPVVLAVAYTLLDDWVSAAPIRVGFEAALATEPVGGDRDAG